MEQKTANVIKKLKAVRKEQGLSLSDVFEKVDAVHPAAVSMSTLQRIFADGSEKAGFRYSSIQPVASVMLGVEGEDENDEFSEEKAYEYYLQRNALQDVVSIRATEEERLRTRLETSERQAREEITKQSLLHDQNIDRLLSMHREHDTACQRAMTIMENNNEFFRHTIEHLRVTLDEERTSKKRMFEEIKKLNEHITQLYAQMKKYHGED